MCRFYSIFISLVTDTVGLKVMTKFVLTALHEVWLTQTSC